MGKRKVLTRGMVLAAILAVAVFAGSGSAIAASKNGSREGTFYGVSDSAATWLATFTRGSNATVGQLAMEWISWDPTFSGTYPTAVRTANPLGVWKKVNQKEYKFTWIAFGFDANGSALYMARASGAASKLGIDQWAFTYVLELFDPAQGISPETPALYTFCGTGTETRMPLVQVTCPQ